MNITTEQIFEHARTQNGFTPAPVTEAKLRQLWDLMKWGPTSANSNPARILFVSSPEAKEKLLACVSVGNFPKVQQAPVTAIVGMDLEFYEKLPQLFPHADARPWFAGKPKMIEETAFRNGTLQGAYLIIAARALGLDCGPMSGFDQETVNRAFFPDGRIKANFLCNLGYGNGENMFARSPRLSFEEACSTA